MILCNICQTSNHHLAVICTSCGGYLQTRVDTLDLFSTAWKVIERPIAAFRTIAISRYKNYALFLSAIAGIAISFSLFWAIHATLFADSILNILAAGVLTGPVLGIVVVLILSLLVLSISVLFGGRAGFRSTYAVIAYACIPSIMIALFIVPVEIVTFGQYFFSKNPSPYSLKPLVYVVLLILHGSFAVWNVMLLAIAVRVLTDVSWFKSIGICILSLLILGGFCMETLHMVTLPK